MAAINKSFVIKNGLEISTDLIIANATTRKVGIGTTVPQYTLHVNGGIGATDAYVSGIATVSNQLRVGTGGTVFTVLGVGNSIGVGTANPAFLLDVRSPVSTGQTALYVQGDVRITGDLVVEDDLVLDEVTTRNITVSNQATTLNLSATGIGTITTLNSTSGTITNLTSTNLTGTSGTITTFNSTSGTITNLTGTSGTITTLNSTSGTITNLNVTGISTLGTVKVSSGIITATSGIVTYYGDGQYLNLSNSPYKGIGIGTTGGVVGYGITFLNLKGAGVSTTQYNSSTGIATIFFEGGGGSGSISISTTAPALPNSGDLWYSPDYGRTFIYYDESVVGYGTDAFWVDAAPFNVGVITSTAFAPASASAPSIHFAGDVQTGFFSPSSGNITAVSVGSSILNVNPSGINVTGVVTATEFDISGSSNTLTAGGLNVGVATATEFDISGSSNTLTAGGLNVGVATATSFFGALTGNATGLSGTPNITVGNIVGVALTLSGNLTVNGTQTIINTTNLEITDPLVGIGSGNTTDAQANGDGILIYGATNKTLTYNDTKKAFETNVAWATTDTRFISVAEKLVRVNGNTVSLVYNTTGANIGFATNPSGNITLAVTGIPTSSDFDNHVITFSVFVNQTGTARTCTAVTLNGVSKTIKWSGGSLSVAISGVTTTSGYDIYSFTGINTVGSASTTVNYDVLGVVNGGFR